MVCLLEYRRHVAGPSGHGPSIEPIPDKCGWKNSTGLANRTRSIVGAAMRNVRKPVKGSGGRRYCCDSRFVRSPIGARRLRCSSWSLTATPRAADDKSCDPRIRTLRDAMTWVCTPSVPTAPRMALPSTGGALSVQLRFSLHCRTAAPSSSGHTRTNKSWMILYCSVVCTGLGQARPEYRENRLALVLEPHRDLLVAAHAGKCRDSGESEHRWQAVPSHLPAP